MLFAIAIFAAWLLPAAPPASAARFVASRDVDVAFGIAGEAKATDARLYVSTDEGQSWRAAESRRLGERELRFRAERDGPLGLFVIVENAAGASSDPPKAGQPPHARIIIDTTAPAVQIHGAAPSADEASGQIAIDATVADENLNTDSLRVYFRPAAAREWTDGGRAELRDGRVRWTPPRGVPADAQLRLIAFDLAGNAGRADLPRDRRRASSRDDSADAEPEPAADRAVRVEPVAPVRPLSSFDERPEAEREDAADSRAASGALSKAPFAELGAAAPSHNRDAEFGAAASSKKPDSGVDAGAADNPTAPPGSGAISEEPTAEIDSADLLSAERLRKQAARFLAEGRHALAIARYEEALAAAPQEPGLMVELGGALFRARRYTDAGERFAEALRLHPDDGGALEGLALLAATQKRYPEAKERLEQLLKIDPQSARTWLRLGDVEHRLGRRDAALRAWESALRLDRDAETSANARKRIEYFGQKP